MATSLAPVPAGALGAPASPAIPVAPVDPSTTHIEPLEPGTPTSIHDAGKAFRDKLAQAATDTLPAATDPAAQAPAASTEQPRNPDGTFAAKQPAEGEQAPAVETPAAPETPAEGTEPKVFVLKGEAQRGEPDIELDASSLPPEVVERLDRAQKQGMRRTEYDTAMGKVRSLQADLDAVETAIAIDPQGFVLEHVAPAHRPELATTLLFEHWDELAPIIQQYWQDPASRLRMQQQIREGITGRKTTVQQQVAQSRQVMQVKAAVQALVPETADDSLASEFTQTALALLAARKEVIAPGQVSQLLATHVGRYFGAQPVANTPPQRPKLAVKPAPSAASPAAPVPAAPAVPVVSPDEVARQIQQRRAAGAVAPQGAGPAAVQRPGPPANATVEQASKWWRAQKGR